MDMFSYLLGKSTGGGGGGGTPKTLAELNTNYVEPFYNFLINTPNSFEPYTNDNVTIYTPDATCKSYIIYKRDNSYRVVWTKTDSGFLYIDTIGSIVNLYPLSNYRTDFNQWIRKIKFTGTSVTGYRTGDLSSIEACISALENSNTYYYSLSDPLGSVKLYDDHSAIISNTCIVEEFNGEQEIWYPQKLSKNENIQVKS